MLARWARLYGKPTPAERALEPAIASLGVPYRFQHPLWALSCFPDFVLLDQRVVIEVDDPSHDARDKRRRDEERTRKLQAAGWRVVRCRNDDVLSTPLAPYQVINRLMAQLGLTLRTNPPERP